MSKTFESDINTNTTYSPITSSNKTNLNPLLSRKFLFSLLLTILSFVLVLTGKLTSKEWTDFVMIISGIYATSNVASKFAQK